MSVSCSYIFMVHINGHIEMNLIINSSNRVIYGLKGYRCNLLLVTFCSYKWSDPRFFFNSRAHSCMGHMADTFSTNPSAISMSTSNEKNKTQVTLISQNPLSMKELINRHVIYLTSDVIEAICSYSEIHSKDRIQIGPSTPCMLSTKCYYRWRMRTVPINTVSYCITSTIVHYKREE